LWGCTGFTGGLVAEYFATSAPRNIKWALAGRTPSKLEAVRERLTKIDPNCKDLTLIEANITDERSLDEMASQTKVILSTAGPFIKCGTPIVAACVRNSTHYCDITGEVPWIAQLIEKYHEEAVEKKIHIVPACGFDSIPFDLGAFMVARAAESDGGAKWIKGYAKSNGRPSGGTLHTMLNLMETVPVKKIQDPHILDPPAFRSEQIQPKAKDQTSPSYDKYLKTWTCPFVMSGVNTRVVRRSSLLLKEADMPYGPNEFYYAETEIKKSFLGAFFHTLAIGCFVIFAYFSLGRAILKRVMPSPGTGPSAAVRAKSWFQIRFVGETVQGNYLSGIFAGGDPGYTETAKMVSNAAICLVDADKLPLPGGVLTSASSMGETLITRLKDADMELKVEPFTP